MNDKRKQGDALHLVADEVLTRGEGGWNGNGPHVVLLANQDVGSSPLAVLVTGLIDLEPDGATVTSEKFRDGWKGKRTP